MKKILVMMILPILASCGALEKDIPNVPIVYTTVSSAKLPKSDLPKEINIANKKYTLSSAQKSSRGNDGRINFYSNKAIPGGFVVFDEIAETEKDALALLRIEVDLRHKDNKIVPAINKQDGSPFLISEGYDREKNLGFFILGTYDKNIKLLRTRIFLYPPSTEAKDANTADVDHMIEGILANTKVM